MTNKRRVFVLGAGFTRAFIPAAPLVEDQYDIASLVAKFRAFPAAQRILEVELKATGAGRLNIERIMTRLDGSMPYDSDTDADQLRMLLADVLHLVVERLRTMRNGTWHEADMAAFARYCLKNQITCITFNYDDAFDQALWEVERAYRVEHSRPYWHPDGGYGFFCKPSDSCIQQTLITMDTAPLLLLKLHGSLNWRPKRGVRAPYALDDVVHHEAWSPHEASLLPANLGAIEAHLAPAPLLIPPVLMKSALVEQPLLRLIWSLAYDELRKAEEVVFVGYSFPTTDIGARFLFLEGLEHLGHSDIRAINYATDTDAQKRLIRSYQSVFPNMTANQFEFGGALEWARALFQTEDTTTPVTRERPTEN